MKRLGIVVAGVLLVVARSAAAQADGALTVATSADVVNGDVTTVARLVAKPGPDGVSLREALQATNNDPGTHTIRFAPALAGTAIRLNTTLPFLTGGRVTVEGDIDGDGAPDVTLGPGPQASPIQRPWALRVSSSGNRLHALKLEGFATGVMLQAERIGAEPFPSHRTYAGNSVENLVIRDVGTGISLDSFVSPGCDPFTSPCATANRWTSTAITGNTIESRQFGILLGTSASVGDRIEGATITGNTVRLGTLALPASLGAAIQVDQHGNASQSSISGVEIARNTVEAVNGDGGIVVASGLQRSQANTISGVRIADNRVHLVRQGGAPCCFAIVIDAGSDTWAVNVRPVRYPDGNVVRGVLIERNSVSGSLAAGVRIQAGVDAGASRNRIENVRIRSNTIRSTMMGKGVYMWAGDLLPFEGTYAMGNRITGVTIDANRIAAGSGKPIPGETSPRTAGGVVLVGGWHYGRDGLISGVRIRSNRIAGARAGIRLIGGIGPTARGNRVRCVRIARNRFARTRKRLVVTPNLAERPGEGQTPGKSIGNCATMRGC